MLKKIENILDGNRTQEGDFQVRRAFPGYFVRHLDPFLLLDHFGPQDPDPNQHGGVKDHPHRGFETVTYLFSGEIEHKDSKGNQGIIGPGDVQWMTAAKGIIHAEEPSDTFKNSNGKLHGIQLWVNLPAKDKMTEPAYQELKSDDFAVLEVNDKSKIKLISGEYENLKGLAKTHTPINYFHISIKPGGSMDFKMVEDWTALIYIVKGKGKFQNEMTVEEAQLIIFEREGSEVKIENTGTESLEFMILNGKQIGESIVSHGPFVMNTEDEIRQAFADFQGGKFV